jgi:hypothetical protein
LAVLFGCPICRSGGGVVAEWWRSGGGVVAEWWIFSLLLRILLQTISYHIISYQLYHLYQLLFLTYRENIATNYIYYIISTISYLLYHIISTISYHIYYIIYINYIISYQLYQLYHIISTISYHIYYIISYLLYLLYQLLTYRENINSDTGDIPRYRSQYYTGDMAILFGCPICRIFLAVSRPEWWRSVE